MHRLARALDSPLFLLPLVFAVTAVGVAWQETRDAALPPNLPSYDWGKHPNALLIAIPTNDCGCGMKPVQVAKAALEHGLDVVIVATKPGKEIARVQQAKLPPGRVALFTDVRASVVGRFIADRSSGVALIRDGRITHQIKGNLPENFLKTLEKEA